MIDQKFKAFIKPKEIKIQTNREIWGYTRVSSKLQVDNYSIGGQEASIREFARNHNYDLTEMLGGTYESASGDFSRREFRKLIEEIKKRKKKPFAIAIKFINRFSRTGGSAIGIVNELIEKMGVHIIETSTGLCTESESDRIEVYQKLLLARKDNMDRLKLIVPGMIAFLENGNKLGKVPFGYTLRGKRVKDYSRINATQVIEINAQGEILKQAWHWKLQGERDYVILNKLDKLGIKLSTQTISGIWRNPFYCGILINKLLDEPVRGNWTPMITESHFWKVQEQFQPPKVGKYDVVTTSDQRPLARFLICGQCNSLMTGYEVKKKKVHYYKCNYCKGVTMNAHTTKQSRNIGLNNSFKDLIDTIQLKDEYIAPFKAIMDKMFTNLNSDILVQLNEHKKQLDEYNNMLKILEKKFLFTDSVGEDVYLKHRSQLERDIRQKEIIIAEVQSKLSNHDKFIDKAIKMCGNISKQWEFGDGENRQRIQKTLFPDGLIVNPKDRSYLTDNMNEIFKLIPCQERVSENDKKQKVGKNADSPCQVARTGIEPMTFGL